MAFIVPAEIPETCLGCPFHTPCEFISVGDGLYKRVSRCILAPEEIEDPWKNVHKMLHGREDWCPLKEVEVSDAVNT